MSYVAEQRHALIVEEVERHQAISIRDLCARFGVTRETIRKDLAYLATRNLVRQVRGGAMQVDAREAPFAERTVTNPEGKRAIGDTVAALIPDGTSVFLDSGSTIQAAISALSGRRDLVIYTNDITIALRLRDTAREVHLLGGRILKGEDSTQGLDAIDMISRYYADFALVSVGGLSADRLFTDYTREGVALRSRMIASAATAFLLVDHTKFGKVTPVRLNNADLAARVVTDRSPDDLVINALKAAGLLLTVAGD